MLYYKQNGTKVAYKWEEKLEILKTTRYIQTKICITTWSLFLAPKFTSPILIISNCSSYVGEGNGTPLQYSCLENPMDEGTWWEAVYGVTKSWARLSDFTFTFQFHALEKEIATHSSVLAWRIPRMAEPGRRLSMGSHRVGHYWSDLAAAVAASR